MEQFIARMMGAAKLDVATYEEVEHAEDAMGQAAAVVVLASLAAGIGSMSHGLGALILGTLGSLLAWVCWAGVIYVIGAKVMADTETEADMGQVMRTLAFAQAPGILRVFGFLPLIGSLIYLVTFFWMLATMVVAVRQALDYESTGRAVGVVLLGFLAYIAIFVLFYALTGGPAPATTAA